MKIENVLVRAKPHYCVPAILETTLKYFGIDNFTQDDIAQYFTIHVPSTSDQNPPNVVIDDNPRNWGIKLDISSLNIFYGYPFSSASKRPGLWDLTHDRIAP